MGPRNFNKPSEFSSFSEIFYCDMTRLKNTNLVVFVQCQVHKNYFKKNKGLFKISLRYFAWHDQTQEHKFGCFYTMPAHKNH